jgi:hypothetical protein
MLKVTEKPGVALIQCGELRRDGKKMIGSCVPAACEEILVDALADRRVQVVAWRKEAWPRSACEGDIDISIDAGEI